MHLHQGVGNYLFDLKRYHEILRKERNGNGGSIDICIKENILHKCVWNYEKPNIAAMWVRINSIQGKILILCYQSPDKGEFGDEFHNCLNYIKNDKIRNVFILGELNADLATVNGRKLNYLCQM